jgi:phosphatidylinositol-3-phosphatase
MKMHSKQLRFASIVLGGVIVILGSSAVAAVLPQPDHTMIIMLENQTYSGIIGSSNAPYINSLLPHAANFTNMHAITHPSQPNYIHFFSGESNGCIDNGPITPYADPPNGIPYQPLTTPNLGAQLLAAGKTFTAFAEGLPSVGWDKYTITSAVGTYYRDENPQANWMTDTNPDPVNHNTLPISVHRPFTDYPSADFNLLPSVAWVHPTEEYTMHQGPANPVRDGDTWLHTTIDSYVQWALGHNSLLILTFDEDDGSTATNRIPTLIIGPNTLIKPGSYDENVNLYSLLRTVEDMYRLAHIGNAATAPAITDAFGIITGDINGDGVVNSQDWPLYRAGMFATTPGPTDLNGDGVNDFNDFVLFKQAYLQYNGSGAFEQMIAGIPEPASLLLLSIGCVILLWRPFARRDVRMGDLDGKICGAHVVGKMIPQTLIR